MRRGRRHERGSAAAFNLASTAAPRPRPRQRRQTEARHWNARSIVPDCLVDLALAVANQRWQGACATHASFQPVPRPCTGRALAGQGSLSPSAHLSLSLACHWSAMPPSNKKETRAAPTVCQNKHSFKPLSFPRFFLHLALALALAMHCTALHRTPLHRTVPHRSQSAVRCTPATQTMSVLNFSGTRRSCSCSCTPTVPVACWGGDYRHDLHLPAARPPASPSTATLCASLQLRYPSLNHAHAFTPAVRAFPAPASGPPSPKTTTVARRPKRLRIAGACFFVWCVCMCPYYSTYLPTYLLQRSSSAHQASLASAPRSRETFKAWQADVSNAQCGITT